MNKEEFARRLRAVCREELSLPGAGSTSERLRRLMEIGREDLSLAKLAEAHWDAVAILAEAGRVPADDIIYGVWASEIPGKHLRLEGRAQRLVLSGTKMFCSGAGLIDVALITAGAPKSQLVEVDLRTETEKLIFDKSGWMTDAFRFTQTSSVTFQGVELVPEALIGPPDWYVRRLGFWHGACGPAACWGGGIAGLLEYAYASRREDAHTLAHLGALQANVWAVESFLEAAGREIDANPQDRKAAEQRALKVRHLVEQACSDSLSRFARTYGPHPLAMDEGVSRRYRETDLYLRQSHAERDLEALGQTLKVASRRKDVT